MMDGYDTAQEPVSQRAQSAMMSRSAWERQQALGTENIGLNFDLSHALKDIAPIVEATRDGHHKGNKYANLADIVRHVNDTLLSHNIRVRFGMERTYSADEGSGSKTRIMSMYCDLVHMRTGEVDRTMYEVAIPRLDPAGIASAFTYGRRYSLLAALGLATSEDVADDDGRRAASRDLNNKRPDTKDLQDLKAIIDKIKDATDLPAFYAKNKASIEKLDDTEYERLVQHYEAHKRGIIEESAK